MKKIIKRILIGFVLFWVGIFALGVILTIVDPPEGDETVQEEAAAPATDTDGADSGGKETVETGSGDAVSGDAVAVESGTAVAAESPAAVSAKADTKAADSVQAETTAQAEAGKQAATQAETAKAEPEKQTVQTVAAKAPTAFDISKVPAYSGQPCAVINKNKPFFSDSDKTTTAFETYSPLDKLGRCGVAYANICKEIMPTEPRGEIGMVKPSGWHTVKYNGVVEGNYLYNRCHLIGYQLAGENANTKNLITGTRYMNTQGMLPYENDTDAYVERTGHHVLYRVTPVFEGSNLVASGVLMEAQSVEDNNFYFCVYCYNVQPGVTINYANGDSALDGTAAPQPAKAANSGSSSGQAAASGSSSGQAAAAGATAGQAASAGTTQPAAQPSETAAAPAATTNDVTGTYILNTNKHKFHLPTCSSVGQMSEKNKKEYTGSRQALIDQGYSPCQRCNP